MVKLTRCTSLSLEPQRSPGLLQWGCQRPQRGEGTSSSEWNSTSKEAAAYVGEGAASSHSRKTLWIIRSEIDLRLVEVQTETPEANPKRLHFLDQKVSQPCRSFLLSPPPQRARTHTHFGGPLHLTLSLSPTWSGAPQKAARLAFHS